MLLLLGWIVYNSKTKVTQVIEKERKKENRTEQNEVCANTKNNNLYIRTHDLASIGPTMDQDRTR